MNRFATCLIALSVLAVSAPSFAKDHEADKMKMEEKMKTNAEKADKAAKSDAAPVKAKRKMRKHNRVEQHTAADHLRSPRHTYPGSSDVLDNRYERGMGLPAAVQQH